MTSLTLTPRDLDTMARTLIGEVDGEPFTGQAGVAWVIRTRAEHPTWWGHGIEGVCRAPKQFSCWNDPENVRRLLAFAVENSRYLHAVAVAALVLHGNMSDPTHGATHYMRFDVLSKTHWDDAMEETARIGAHVFFKERTQ